MGLIEQFGKGWYKELEHVFEQPWWLALHVKMRRELENMQPDPSLLFRAFRETSYENVKVVILGQEPYATSISDGLAFSSFSSEIPTTLRIIFQELELEYGKKPLNGDLTHWARQGVLLLNACLSVGNNSPSSHMEFGWNHFTREVLKTAAKKKNMIFVAWGKPSMYLIEPFIDSVQSLKGYHPLAERYAGGNVKFLGNNHFKTINQLLIQSNKEPIQWI